MTGDYYRSIAAAFDRAAASYDADYAANPIMAWLQEDTFARLCRLFPPGSRLLEVGCGTGQMAIRLAESGREVLATDISPAMIEQAQAAARGRETGERLRWLILPAGQLAETLSPGDAPFDGAYSNFGPLNCEPDLPTFAVSLATHIRPGGAFLCSVMNRWCAWEIGWELLHLRSGEARRRLGRGWVQANMSAGPGEPPSTFAVRYYRPGEFAKAFQPFFRVEESVAYPLVVPPPYLAARFPLAVERLGELETVAARLPGLRALGDHFLLVLRRRQAPHG